jgi:hypothetical protein
MWIPAWVVWVAVVVFVVWPLIKLGFWLNAVAVGRDAMEQARRTAALNAAPRSVDPEAMPRPD